MHAGERKKEEIMADFPSTLNPPSLADHSVLSTIYVNAQTRAKSCHEEELRRQLDILKQHIRTCYELWEAIRSRRLPGNTDVPKLYHQRLSGVAIGVSPR